MPATSFYPVLGRARPGTWCEACALPSAVDWTVYGLPATTGHQIPDGVGGLTLGAIRACMDCGEVTRAVGPR